MPKSNGHFLQQQWWTTTEGGGDQTVSLETGITTSSGWTSKTAKTLFCFSTPNGYVSKTSAAANRENQYNTAGGFIQQPNTRASGRP